MLPLLSLNVLYISYIKIIIIQPMVVCKKELIRTKIIKKKKANGTFERDPISMDLGANTSFVVSICLMDLPRERNTMLEKEETLEEERRRERRYSGRNGNKKGNCVIYSA